MNSGYKRKIEHVIWNIYTPTLRESKMFDDIHDRVHLSVRSHVFWVMIEETDE